MNKKNSKSESSPAVTAFNWQAVFVALLVGVAAFGVVAAQFHYQDDPESQTALANLDRRAATLEQITNLVQRDQMCIGLSAYGRELDQALDPNARVFLTGMVGPTNGPALGFYFFLRNYLFPRDLEISLGQLTYHEDGFYGTSCDSPAVLQTNGFDLVILFANNQMQLLPLTQKGVLKQP